MTEHETQQRFLSLGKVRLGEFGEALWARVFAASGIQYIPLHKIETGGAPMLEGHKRSVLPDFDCVLNGTSVYMDSKVKTQSVLYRRMNEERHGIDRSSWNNYQNTALASGKLCGLGIVELFRERKSCDWSGSLLVETLTKLGTPYDGSGTERHMVYWPRKRFCYLDSFTACELVEVKRGNLRASYPVILEKLFAGKPAIQMSLWE